MLSPQEIKTNSIIVKKKIIKRLIFLNIGLYNII